jgi:hypothetical protein
MQVEGNGKLILGNAANVNGTSTEGGNTPSANKYQGKRVIGATCSNHSTLTVPVCAGAVAIGAWLVSDVPSSSCVPTVLVTGSRMSYYTAYLPATARVMFCPLVPYAILPPDATPLEKRNFAIAVASSAPPLYPATELLVSV